MALQPTYDEIRAMFGSGGALGDVTAGLDPGAITSFLNNLGLNPLSPEGEVPYGDLANALNEFMTKQVQKPYAGLDPHNQQAFGNVLSQLQGLVPQDVTNRLRTGAAEYGIGVGSPGAAPTNAKYLHDLGLTSLGQQKEGLAGLHQLMTDMPVPQFFNPSSLFVPKELGRDELAAALAGRQTAGTTPGVNPGAGGGAGGLTNMPLEGTGQYGGLRGNTIGGPSGGPAQVGVGASGSFGPAYAVDAVGRKYDPITLKSLPAVNPWETGGSPNLNSLWGNQSPGAFDVGYGNTSIKQPPLNFATYLNQLVNEGGGMTISPGLGDVDLSPMQGPLTGPGWGFWNSMQGGQGGGLTGQDIGSWGLGSSSLLGSIGGGTLGGDVSGFLGGGGGGMFDTTPISVGGGGGGTWTNDDDFWFDVG